MPDRDPARSPVVLVTVEPQQYQPTAPDTVKVIEHPWAFRDDGSAYVSVVVVRGDTLSNRYQLWWERATDSYKRLATEARFRLRGTLNAELPATGPLVGTIDFTLVSPDKTLPEIAEDEALMGKPALRRRRNPLGLGLHAGWRQPLHCPVAAGAVLDAARQSRRRRQRGAVLPDR